MIGRLGAVAYVGVVACLAVIGFTGDTPAPILLAGVLALPFSIPAIVAFYAAFGLLAQVPGANPDSASSSSYCTADGVCTTTSSGEAASWFLLTTDVLGVGALTAAALVNIVVIRWLIKGRRAAATRNRPAG